MCPDLLEILSPLLDQHKAALVAALKPSDQDGRELLSKEIQLVDKALKAPKLPMIKNFKKEEKEEVRMQLK